MAAHPTSSGPRRASGQAQAVASPPITDQDRDMAAVLLDLTSNGPAASVPRSIVRARWEELYPDQRYSVTSGQPREGHRHGRGTLARRRVAHTLAKLEKLGAIRRTDTTVVIVDRAALERLDDDQ